MKVQYLKNHTDEYGQKFLFGWSCEHTDAEGQRRINAGICKRIADDARARKQTVVVTECVVTEPPNIATQRTTQKK